MFVWALTANHDDPEFVGSELPQNTLVRSRLGTGKGRNLLRGICIPNSGKIKDAETGRTSRSRGQGVKEVMLPSTPYSYAMVPRYRQT